MPTIGKSEYSGGQQVPRVMVTNIPKARHALFDDLNDRLTTRFMHVDKREIIGGDHLTHSISLLMVL